jgi:hypothetical protein
VFLKKLLLISSVHYGETCRHAALRRARPFTQAHHGWVATPWVGT